MLCGLHVASCSNEQDAVYPNIVSELACIHTDSLGTMKRLVLDNDEGYDISNNLTGYQPGAIYRVLCGYVIANDKARIYQLEGCRFLSDSTASPRRDPVRIVSQWRTKHFLNLHLAPLTQGGRQYYGFIVDSLSIAHLPDGTADTTAFLSIHHNQNGDPLSYTADVYASIPLDSVKGQHVVLNK